MDVRHHHLVAVYYIIRYLIGTPYQGRFFSREMSLELTAYSDNDRGGCPDPCQSTTRWYIFPGDVQNKILFLNSLLRLNIVLCQLLVLRLCGYKDF